MKAILFACLYLAGSILHAAQAAFPYDPSASGATSKQALDSLRFPTGKALTVDAGATLALNGILAGTPASGTLNLSALTLTLPATVGGGTSSFQPLDSDLTSISALSTTPFGRNLLTETSTATLRSTIGPATATIATLKALAAANYATGDIVTVLGYSADNDGGGGPFRYDSTSTATTNPGTIFAPNSGSGRWFRLYSGAISVRWFGAVGHGLVDDHAAIQAAIDFIVGAGHGGVLYFPSDAYLTGNSFTLGPGGVTGSLAVPIIITGDGQSTQIINAAAASTPTFLFAGVSHWQLNNILLTGNSVNPNDGVRIAKNGSNQSCIGWKLENVITQMAGRGFVLEDTNTGMMIDCKAWPSGNTPSLTIPQTVTAADISDHVYMGGGFVNDVTIVGGQFQPSSSFAAGQCGIHVAATSANVINILGVLIEGTSGDATHYGIKMVGADGVKIDCVYADNANILLDQCSNLSISNTRNGGDQTLTLDTCSRCVLTNVTYPNVVLDTVSSVTVTGCQFFTTFSGGTAAGVNIFHSTGPGGTPLDNRLGGAVVLASDLTVIGMATATDYILGAAGPSIKASLAARGPRQRLNFDGTAYPTLSVTGIGTGGYTMAFGLNLTNDTNVRALLDDGGANGCFIQSAGGGVTPFGNVYAYGPAVPTGKDTQIVITRTGGTATLYYDGKSMASHADTYNVGTITKLGGWSAAASYFVGQLSAQIFNRGFSDADVRALYESGVPAKADRPSVPAGTTATSGSLVVGIRYRIASFVAGDDFANVGGTNATGNEFIATATTPTTWTNGSALTVLGLLLDPDMQGGVGPQWRGIGAINLPGDGATGGVTWAMAGGPLGDFGETRTASGYALGRDAVVIPSGYQIARIWCSGNGTFSIGNAASGTEVVNGFTASATVEPATLAAYTTATRKLYITLGTATTVTYSVHLERQ